MMRLLWVALLGLGLISCGGGGAADEEKKNAQLKAEIEALRQEKAEKEAREAALTEQLKNQALEKGELLDELERVKPIADRVGEAGRRAEAAEERVKGARALEE
jgi:ATP-dependent Lon protease